MDGCCTHHTGIGTKTDDAAAKDVPDTGTTRKRGMATGHLARRGTGRQQKRRAVQSGTAGTVYKDVPTGSGWKSTCVSVLYRRGRDIR